MVTVRADELMSGDECAEGIGYVQAVRFFYDGKEPFVEILSQPAHETVLRPWDKVQLLRSGITWRMSPRNGRFPKRVL